MDPATKARDCPGVGRLSVCGLRYQRIAH
jgi:hypothetical protein